MFCPKCGNKIAEDEKCCQSCGYKLPDDIEAAYEVKENEEVVGVPTIQSDAKRFWIIRIIFFILAGIVFIMSQYSAHCIAAGGLNISSIESVGGRTLAEAYYQYSGAIYIGYAAIVRATGIFFASVLSYLGIKG